ncbi:hypothetical protein B6F84_04145 [Acidianus manzaensis]|uniref:Prenyltransferase n=2 Tax=Acidianus manzaensis TaxID=282676 RepID=A0A1W6JYJ0_9CREN|nr:hypothetical protein B6F84_04145 [Acidianus manzaensis]
MLLGSIKNMILITRPWGFIMPTICVSLSYVLGFYFLKIFNLVFYILTLIGVILLNASVDVMNDYFDFKYKVDTENSNTANYRLHPIIHKILSTKQTLIYAIILALIALVIASYLTLSRLYALPFGLIGLLFVYMYNGPPFLLKYRALGEIEIPITYSFIIFASYYIATGLLSYIVFIDGLPIAFLITSILIANNMRDREKDEESNVKTLAILFPRFTNILYLSLIILSYLILIPLAILRYIPLLAILTMITMPFAINKALFISRKLPKDSDPQTANILTLFGIFYIILILLSGFVNITF